MLLKYPRTFHTPWSPGATDDDKRLSDMDHFVGKQIIVSVKMGGENTTMYPNYIHARSLDSKDHPSRHWVKQFWSQIRYAIPEGYRVCGENMFARHSIFYEDLPSYFLGFSIWDAHYMCLSWSTTLEWFQLLGIEPVPVIYEGLYDESSIKSLWNDSGIIEGYVIRLADSFHHNDFHKSVAKFVRANHIQTDNHWAYQQVVSNKLRIR